MATTRTKPEAAVRRTAGDRSSAATRPPIRSRRDAGSAATRRSRDRTAIGSVSAQPLGRVARRLAELERDRLGLGDGGRARGRRRHDRLPERLRERDVERVALVEQVEADLVAGERALEREEAAAMERGQPEAPDSVAMLARGVALVALPAVARVSGGQA